jgi:hypothetical protein
MRFLVVCVFVVFAAPMYAAEKDDDKAKEVAAAFLKALKAKDLDALMKTVDVPFIVEPESQSAKTTEKLDELKETMAELIKIARPDKVMALEVGKVYDMAGIAKFVKDKLKAEEADKFIEQAEKLVGKDGRMVTLMKGEKEGTGFLVRIKDGKALVASIPK